MDAVDATSHYEIYTTEETPSLCTIILDTNPRAWAAINNVLPISKAIANILVFVNSHLAFSNANSVAIIASHTNRAVWLYPNPVEAKKSSKTSEDVEMTDVDAPAPKQKRQSANKYPQFAEIENSLLKSLRELITATTESDLFTTTTQISGALTLALSHINKASIALTATKSVPSANNPTTVTADTGALAGLHARILVVSVSDSAASQYIPTMNAVFAAAHAGIAIDTLALRGSATFLQQASFITRGTFLEAKEPQGLLSYLMFGFASSSAPTAGGAGTGTGGARDEASLNQLISPSTDVVDFRAACFCHRRVVDTGFVCSICLSIFCEVPENAECLTCGTKLSLGSYGAKPAVVPRQRKKKKRRLGINGEGREETGSATGTPRPG